MSPWFVLTPCTLPSLTSKPVTSTPWWISTPRAAGLLGVAPDDGVVADDPAGRVVERALDRPRHVLADVDLRAELLHLLPVDHAAVDPEQLVHLGALVLHDERAVGVREREVPVLREHHVEVEVGGELLVELDALRVERGALGRAVVRADDRRVPPGRARADVALLEDRDVGDAVVDREVVRGREAVRAAADDDDVVVLLQRRRAASGSPCGRRCPSCRASRERVDADRAAAERRTRGRPRPPRRSGRAPAAQITQ